MTLRLHVNAVGIVMGGGATHLAQFLPALREARPDWDITLYSSVDSMSGLDSVDRIVHIQGGARRRLVWDSFLADQRARRRGADAVLYLANYGPLFPRVPAFIYQRNALFFDRTWLRGRNGRERAEAWLRRMLAFAQARRAAVVITPSEAMAGMLRSWRAFPRKVRVAVVPHGVNPDRFPFQTRFRSVPIRIASHGHGSVHKDQALLIDMMGILVSKGYDVTLEMTVDDRDAPAYVAALRRKVGEAGLGARVMFVGRMDPAEFLSRADVAVLASLTESFGFPVAEAMASGIPVVASSIPAFCELLGPHGWFFNAGDASGAAARVIEVLAAPPDELDRHRSAARRRVEGMSWERNAVAVAQLIEQLARGTSTPGR